MGIYAPLSTPIRSREFALASAATLTGDGQALIRSVSGQVVFATNSAGSAGEQFVGFLSTQTSAVSFLQTTAVKVERFTVPAGKTVTLSKTPNATTTFVWDVTAGAAVTPNSVTGAVVDLTTGGTIGNVVDVTFRYNVSVAEARSRNGDVTPGLYSGLTTGTVAVWQSGTIYTDMFASNKNWQAIGTQVFLAAGGLVDITGNVAIPASVISIPTVDFPFLGLEFDAF